MKYIYSLSHSHLIDENKLGNVYETKQIGYFSSYERACEIVEQYKKIIGFMDYPNGFKIEKIEIDFDNYNFD